MHILHTVLHTLPEVLTRRICVTIKSFFGWWSLPLFSWPQSVIQHCYCKEKLVFSHTQGLKDYQLDQITNGSQLHAGVTFFLSVTDQTISKSAAQWNIIFKPNPSCCKWGLSILHSSEEKKAPRRQFLKRFYFLFSFKLVKPKIKCTENHIHNNFKMVIILVFHAAWCGE